MCEVCIENKTNSRVELRICDQSYNCLTHFYRMAIRSVPGKLLQLHDFFCMRIRPPEGPTSQRSAQQPSGGGGQELQINSAAPAE